METTEWIKKTTIEKALYIIAVVEITTGGLAIFIGIMMLSSYYGEDVSPILIASGIVLMLCSLPFFVLDKVLYYLRNINEK